MFRLIVLAAALLTSISAYAAELGRTTIGGQTVIIETDGTWHYAPQPATDSALIDNKNCNDLIGNLSFCPDPARLSISAATPGDFAALYTSPDPFYAGLIIETVGRDKGVTPALVRKMALTVAGAQMNVSPENVNIVDEQSYNINGMQYLTVSYAVNVDGLDTLFQNNIYVGQNVTVQLLLWQIGHEANEAFHAMGDHIRASLFDRSLEN